MLSSGESGPGHMQPAGRDGHVAAGDVEVAGEPDEHERGPLQLHAVDVVHHRGRARHHGRRLAGGVEDGGIADLARRDSGDLLRPIQGELGRVPAEFIEAPGPARHELPVVQALGDDEVRHGEGQGTVGAGPQLQVDIRHGSQGGHPGIRDDELHPPFPGVEQMPGLGSARVERVAPKGKDALGVGEVGRGALPVDGAPSHAGGRGAGARFRAVVGRAIEQREPGEEGPRMLGVPAVEDHRLRAALGFDGLQLPGDGIQGFAPGDRHHLSAAAGAHPLERRADPVFVIDPLTLGRAFGAQGARVLRILQAALDLDDPAVFDVAVEPALGDRVADRADGLSDFDPG